MWKFQYFSFYIEVIVRVYLYISTVNIQTVWKNKKQQPRGAMEKRCSETFSKTLEKPL